MNMSPPHSFYLNVSVAFLLYASGRFYTETVRIVAVILYLILRQRLRSAARVTDTSLYAIEIEHYLGTTHKVDVVTVLDTPQVAVGIVESREVECSVGCYSDTLTAVVGECKPTCIGTLAHRLSTDIVLAHVRSR